MSGIDDPGAPQEVPEEYAAVYRDAYLRALEEDPDLSQAPADGGPPDPLAPLPPAGESLRRWRIPLLIALAVLVLAAAGFGIGRLLAAGNDPSPVVQPPRATQVPGTNRPTPTGDSATPRGEPTTSADAWDGVVVPVAPDSIEASCTSNAGVDSAGRPVAYDAANALDGDPTTAWRCDGRAIGTTLTITLPAGTAVGEVGLIPGYAKTDPRSGADRYAENNRITRVRWTFEDGTSVEQHLDPAPKDRELQRLRVPRTATGTITLEVLAVKGGARNTTAISEIEVAAAG